MQIYLNQEQAKGLANFFFDVAKGLILGGIGFSLVTPLEIKIIYLTLGSLVAAICLRVALNLLEKVE